MRALAWISIPSIVLAIGCSNNEQASCARIAGEWGITGGCGADLCTISQTACSTTFDCDNARGVSGRVQQNQVSWEGETATGTPGNCSGTVSGDRISGTCTIAGSTCDFVAMRVSAGTDSGPPERDSAVPPVDAGNMRDSGPPPTDGGPPMCASFAGSWGVTGTCGADTCEVMQTGCTTSFDCSSSPAATTGSVTGSTATWRGNVGGQSGTCTATLAGSTFSGTCTLDIGPTCTITGTRL